jgi:hypothetical protein
MNKFISKDRSTLKAYYTACIREAKERKDKKEYNKYQQLLEELESQTKIIIIQKLSLLFSFFF